jgi:hypothetical protein
MVYFRKIDCMKAPLRCIFQALKNYKKVHYSIVPDFASKLRNSRKRL